MHRSNTETVQKSLPKRYRSEFLFKAIGLGAIIIGLLLVFMLFYNIISKGYSAFTQTYVELPIFFDPEVIDAVANRKFKYTMFRVPYVEKGVGSLYFTDAEKDLRRARILEDFIDQLETNHENKTTNDFC